jgi:hypothetical protein
MIVNKFEWNHVEKMVKAGYTDYGFTHLVDGKQRISTIISFMMDEFPDAYGAFYSQYSRSAQGQMLNYCGLKYGELNNMIATEDVVKTFLDNTIAGTPISKEHIEFMQSLIK